MKKGFTLIEFLVVMIIISILIFVVTPIAVNALKKAKATNNTSNITYAELSLFFIVKLFRNCIGSLIKLEYLFHKFYFTIHHSGRMIVKTNITFSAF